MIAPAPEETEMQTNIFASTAEVRTVLVRIDALMDELYALRQVVRQWGQGPLDVSQFHSVQEQTLVVSPVATHSATLIISQPQSTSTHNFPTDDPHREVRLAIAALPMDSLTRQLAGSLGFGSADEIYTNAEIDEMRFGDERH